MEQEKTRKEQEIMAQKNQQMTEQEIAARKKRLIQTIIPLIVKRLYLLGRKISWLK